MHMQVFGLLPLPFLANNPVGQQTRRNWVSRHTPSPHLAVQNRSKLATNKPVTTKSLSTAILLLYYNPHSTYFFQELQKLTKKIRAGASLWLFMTSFLYLIMHHSQQPDLRQALTQHPHSAQRSGVSSHLSEPHVMVAGFWSCILSCWQHWRASPKTRDHQSTARHGLLRTALDQELGT